MATTKRNALAGLLTLSLPKPDTMYPSHYEKTNVMKSLDLKTIKEKEKQFDKKMSAADREDRVDVIRDPSNDRSDAADMLRKLVQTNPLAAQGLTGNYGTKLVKPSESSMLVDLLALFDQGKLGDQDQLRNLVAKGVR